jgi:hypothetical protein
LSAEDAEGTLALLVTARANEQTTPLRKADGSSIVSARFLAAMRAAAEAIFATEAGPPPTERLDWLCVEIEDFLAHAGSNARFLLRFALLAVSVLAPLFLLRFTRLKKLPLAERVRALTRLEHSALGSPVLALKALLCVLYYEHPDAAREIGFDGLCFKGSSS